MTEFNYIVANGYFECNKDLIRLLFGSDEEVHILSKDANMWDILVHSKIFQSKNQARKNWTRTGGDIPPGFTDLQKIGKLNQRITIWNPIYGPHFSWYTGCNIKSKRLHKAIWQGWVGDWYGYMDILECKLRKLSFTREEGERRK